MVIIILSESVLAQVVGLSTSREVWESLRKHFSSQSQSRVLYLKRELQNMRKGNKTMAEYYLHAKQLADNLAASGNPISNTDLQHMMLGGLDSSYDPIVTVLTATAANLHMDDFYSNLLAYEMRWEAQNASSPQPIANLAHHGSSRPNNGYNNFNGTRNRSGSQGHKNRSSNKAQSRPPPNRNAQGPCQLCGRKNHTALECWYRFDRTFTAASSSSPPAAYVARPGSLLDGNWCPDSGASHHLTSDLSNLHIKTQYDGPDQIKVGNALKKAICAIIDHPKDCTSLAMSTLKKKSSPIRQCTTPPPM
ncbi:hypothetical protein Scep_022389 [Stephania cephalantha]|uniref:Gag protein n=1 Tax=Stephania cephalantha TaxID=152367 RepID=A0AAP0F7V3_9MAGN